MDFEPNFKVHNLVNVHPKNIKLGQMTNLNMIFCLKFETRPSSLLNFGMANTFYYFHTPHKVDGGRFLPHISTLKTVQLNKK